MNGYKGKKQIMIPMKRLDEKTMCELEERIPFLAEDAVKKARTKTLSSGRNVVEAVNGKLIESHPDGSYRVIRPLASPIPVASGQKRIRRSK
ncbi:MAG: hypothetical protein HIU83_11810 [Proteobacteria bacterium]|nr:hypothetical protein [Pseudomonadota bacterium]